MFLQRIKYPNGTRSWTAIDEKGSLVDVIHNFSEHLMAIDYSPNTIRKYVGSIIIFGNWLQHKNITFERVTAKTLDDFFNYIAMGSEVKTNVEYLHKDTTSIVSPSTINNYHSAIKKFYKFIGTDKSFLTFTEKRQQAYQPRGYRSFLYHIEMRKPKKVSLYRRKTKKVFTPRLSPEQVVELIEACENYRDVLLITILYMTGMRIGEALGLRISDIDFSELTINIIYRENNPNNVRAKSHTNRKIAVNELLINLIADYLTSECYKDAFNLGADFIFTNVKAGIIGTPMTYWASESLIRRLRKKTGIYFTWHWLRHTHISECIAQGYTLLEVATRAGHTNTDTTNNTYKHLFSGELKKYYLQSQESIRSSISSILARKEGDKYWR